MKSDFLVFIIVLRLQQTTLLKNFGVKRNIMSATYQMSQKIHVCTVDFQLTDTHGDR